MASKKLRAEMKRLEAEMKRLKAEGVHLPGDVPAGVLCWLIHHRNLLEMTTEPLSERVRFIYNTKADKEIPVRLKWMRPVWGELPKSVVDATREVLKAKKAYVKGFSPESCGRLGLAENKWDRVVRRCRKSIEKLHAKECPGCPWDGETLFPTKGRP